MEKVSGFETSLRLVTLVSERMSASLSNLVINLVSDSITSLSGAGTPTRGETAFAAQLNEPKSFKNFLEIFPKTFGKKMNFG